MRRKLRKRLYYDVCVPRCIFVRISLSIPDASRGLFPSFPLSAPRVFTRSHYAAGSTKEYRFRFGAPSDWPLIRFS